MRKFIVTSGAAVVGSFLLVSAPVLANGITGWSCEAGASTQTLTLTTSDTMSNGAVVNINGAAQTGATEVSGNSISVAIASSVACWDSTFTITDGASTFGAN